MLCYRKAGQSAAQHRVAESQLVEAAQLLLQHGARFVLNLTDRDEDASRVHGRTALMQAAADGRLQLCDTLLAAGAAIDVRDSDDQSGLDLLFYLKHSHLRVHRQASAGYDKTRQDKFIVDFSGR